MFGNRLLGRPIVEKELSDATDIEEYVMGKDVASRQLHIVAIASRERKKRHWLEVDDVFEAGWS